MLTPSGAPWITWISTPRLRRIPAPPTRLRRWRSRRPPAGRPAGDPPARPSRPGHSRRARPRPWSATRPRPPTGAPAGGAPAPPSTAASSASRCSSTASDSLRLAGREQLDAVVGEGVARGGDDRSRRPFGRRPPGPPRAWGPHPGSRRRHPRWPGPRPARPRAPGRTGGCRARWRTARRPAPRCSAQPSASASSGVSSAPATPGTPSVPNFSMFIDAHRRRDRAQRFEYWVSPGPS